MKIYYKLLCFFGLHKWGFDIDDILRNQMSKDSPYFCCTCGKRMKTD